VVSYFRQKAGLKYLVKRMLELALVAFMLYMVIMARKYPIMGILGAGGLTVILGLSEGLSYTFKAVSLTIIWLYTILSTLAKLSGAGS